VANYVGPSLTYQNTSHWIQMGIYQYLLTDDEQINRVLVKRYESELLPLLQRRERLESEFNDLTMYDIGFSTWVMI
jgi:hypothetical protein